MEMWKFVDIPSIIVLHEPAEKCVFCEGTESFTILYIIIFIVDVCFANNGVNEAYNLCIVYEEIHQLFRPKMRQYF